MLLEGTWDHPQTGGGTNFLRDIQGLPILILFVMSKPAIKALRDYEEQRQAGVDKYTFDPDKLGIKNADFWKT